MEAITKERGGQLTLHKNSSLHISMRYKVEEKKKRPEELHIDFLVKEPPKKEVSIQELTTDLSNQFIKTITQVQVNKTNWVSASLRINCERDKYILPLNPIRGEVSKTQAALETGKIRLTGSSYKKRYQISIKGVSIYYLKDEGIDQEQRKRREEIINEVLDLFTKDIKFKKTGILAEYRKKGNNNIDIKPIHASLIH